MTQADRVLSTPPTNTSATNPPGPVDPTRRRLLTVAAGGAVAAMAISTTAQAAGSPADPIFAAIAAHQKAHATMQAAFAEHRQAHEVADAKVGPSHLRIPSMVEPGEIVEVDCRGDIERAVPREQFPDLNAHHKRLLDDRMAAHAAVVESLIGDEDEATAEVCGPEFDAQHAFSETVPTTIPGLLAMIVYAGEITQRDAEAFADSNCSLIETLATAAKAIAQVQS
jgi:hypothetical protein